MSLKTRLDGRSGNNASFKIKDSKGNTLAEISLSDKAGATLEVATAEGLYIEKPTGWTSQK